MRGRGQTRDASGERSTKHAKLNVYNEIKRWKAAPTWYKVPQSFSLALAGQYFPRHVVSWQTDMKRLPKKKEKEKKTGEMNEF